MDYLLDENNNIPITIIEIFPALSNHSFHNDKGTFTHSIIQGEVDYKHVSNNQLDMEKKLNFLSIIQEYYADDNEYQLYTTKINICSTEPKIKKNYHVLLTCTIVLLQMKTIMILLY